jgi:RHS repeat-associated protein
VNGDAEAPVVEIFQSLSFAYPNEEVTFAVQATDNVGVEEISLSINGLQSYQVEVAPIGSDTFVEVFTQSDNPAEVENGILGQFDPTLLANGPYTLRLSAVDNNGATSAIETQIEVAGDLKLGNFQLSFTDLEVPVAGIPITVTRTYDSLSANEQDNFGYGWRLEFRDTNLQTNLEPPTPEEELLGRRSAFRDGTRVYITLPGGKRESFTFDPVPDRMLGIAAGLAGQPASAFRPRFVAEDGSELTLTVDDVLLSYDSATGQYFSANPMGLPYNPEDPRLGGQYTLTTKEGIEYEIDAKTGDLLQVKDLNDNTLTYSDAGIVSSTGKEVKFERDAEGRIKKAIDPQGYEIQYEYDENGDLVKVIDREGNETELFYENSDRPHYLTRIEDPLGRNGIRTEYDPDTGRLIKMLDVNGKAIELQYDPDNSTQTVRDIYGEPTTYVYDENGNVLTEIQPSGLRIERTYENNQIKTETFITEESGPAGWTTIYDYDSQGNKITETDPLGNTIRYTHNQYGQVLTVTDPLGNTVTSDYSPRGNLRSTDDGNGNITHYSNDLNGNIRRLETGNNSIVFDYYGDGNVKTLEDDLGNKGEYEYTPNGDLEKEILTIQTPDGEEQIVTEWIYDKEGRLKTQIQGENRIDYDYDDNGNQIASIADGQTTQYRYDEKGQLVETIYPDDNDDPTDNPRTITVYDKGGRERASIDREGNVTHYEYDVAGRLTKTIYADDSTNQVEELIAVIAPDKTIATIDWTEVIYPDETPSYLDTRAYSGTEYTQDGRVKAEFDSDNNRTEYKYDPIGRPIEIRYNENHYITNTYDKAGNHRTETYYEEGTQWSNTYDELGNLISFIDRNNQATQYEYDDRGQLKAVVDAKKGRTEYQYDENDRLESVKDALNQTTTYEYNDPFGRITKITLPDTSKSSTYTYNDAEDSVTVKDFNGDEIKYFYNDETGKVLRKEFLASGTSVTFNYDDTTRTETVISDLGTTIYKYDELGRLISRKDPEGLYIDGDGASIEYVYEGNQLTVKTPNQTIVYEYNENGTLKSVTTPEGMTEYRYEESRLVKTIFPNDTAEVIIYDELGRIDIIKTVKIEPTTEAELEVLASYDYKVDDAGNREEVIDHNGRKVEYEYDELNRVTEEKITNPFDASEDGRTVTYTYDAVGNRLSKDDSLVGLMTYVYENNLLVQETQGDRETIYDYDNNGNLTSRLANNTEETIYTWDDENRLIGVETPNGDIISYAYDENNIRVSSTVNGVKKNYVIDANRPYAQVLEEHKEGQLDASYVYGLDLISQQRGGENYFYHVDGLGSTRALSNEDGNLTDTYSYDAYGTLINSSGTTVNPYLFAGEQYDPNLEQYYLRQRYYDPQVGRFTRRDTYEGRLDEPVTLHKYLYANANPVNYIDPSGYFSLKEALLAIDIGSTLFDAAQFIFAPTPQGAFFLLVGALDFLPPGFIKGLTKAVPENKIRFISDAIQDFLSGKASLVKSELAANKWLKSLGHVPLFSDKNLKDIAKNIGKKKGMKIDQNRVVDFVAKSKGNDNILLLTEAKSGLSKREIENAIGKAGARANSKFASTETLLKQIYDDTDEAALIIEDYVITYRDETLTKMGSYKIIDGRLFDGADLVQINGKPVIMQKVTEFFS